MLWAVLWCGAGFAGQVFADEMPNMTVQRFSNWERASDSELEQLRGGFILPNGLSIDFSLERIVSLNGAVVSSSFFQLPGNALLFQNGDLNQASDLVRAPLASVIQNSLDNQMIKTMTDINIAISNFKNLDLNNRGMVFNSLILPNTH